MATVPRAITMLPGTRIAAYEITAAIGAGGMGEVFRARDTRLERDVAIKVLPRDFVSDTDRLRRFEQEAKTLAALNHPNIITIHDAGVSEGAPYLVSELLEGRTLREVLSATTNLPLRKAMDYAQQIANALGAAHSKGIIHRDLKPENVFITDDGRLKLLDFGLSKLRAGTKSGAPPELRHTRQGLANQPEGDGPTELQSNANSTNPGIVLGTPNYMAPEQVRAEPLDHRADIFAFGAVLYEMVSGQRPFRRDTSIATMAAILDDDPQDLRFVKQDLPPGLVRIIYRCLEKQPDRRFQTAADLGFALETLSGSSTTLETGPPRAAQGKLLMARVVLAMGILCLVLGVVFFVRSRGPVVETKVAFWRGERLGGPVVAFTPRPSRDGKEIAMCAMVDGLSQAAVMIIDTGDSRILTTNRTRGLVSSVVWSRDENQIFYDRVAGGPNGVYRISKLGGEERLVLEGASDPRVAADGSILVVRRHSDGNDQLSLFSSETERVRDLNGLPDGGPLSTIELLASRQEAVFWGRTTNDPSGAPRLWRLDLQSGMSTPFLSNVMETSTFGPPVPFAASPDGQRFFFTQKAAGLSRISGVNLRHPEKAIPCLLLMDRATALQIDSAGSFYLDQAERPYEILRGKPGGAVERFLLPPADGRREVLPLPHDRFLVPTDESGSGRLMVMAAGQGLSPFVASKLDIGAPFARLGKDQVVLTIREGARYGLATVSLEGRGIKRLEGISWADRTDLAVAGAPDGETIYFAQGGHVYSLPASGGTPSKLCAGHSVAPDPRGQSLVVLVRGADGNGLVRYTFSDRSERTLPISGKYPPAGAAYALGPSAVSADGRILVMVAPLDSWFWATAIIEPTGAMSLATDLPADMYGAGWDEEGRFVTSARFYRSSVWRFRPEE